MSASRDSRSPDADWNAVTAIARDTPAKSASGARIGITSAACPDDDGTRNAIGMLTMNARIANAAARGPDTAFSIQCRIVSVMYAFFITTVMPRAKTMISPAPRKSDAPATIVVTVPSSPSPRDHADHDRHHQEQHDRLGEVEVVERRQREVLAEPLLPEVVPRDEAVDHQQERAAEEREHDLLPTGELRARR